MDIFIITINNKNEEIEITQHSLFLEDYSVILSEDSKQARTQALMHNYINIPLNGLQQKCNIYKLDKSEIFLNSTSLIFFTN